MGIVIGAGTTVSFELFAGGTGCYGATQASWDYSPNTQRMYQLGSWAPCSTLELPTQTLNLTFYTGAGSSYNVQANTSCTNSTVTASVIPASCTAALSSISGDWFVTSYSYSKSDARQPATESWSLMKYAGDVSYHPDYNIRGICEGSITCSQSISAAKTMTGVNLAATGVSTGSTGSVSSGQIGREDYVYSGVAESVGGGTSIAGEVGSASVSVPYTPMWE